MIQTYTPTDPLLSSQWHLYMIGRLGYGTSADLSGLQRVWADYTGAGVDVGIWDSGVEAGHWDLSANYDATQQVTIGGLLNNGQPITADDGHGTSVAGLIGADNNGLGGVGIAFDSSLTSVRIFGGADDINSYWSRYLQTLDHLGDFDVTNHSYGGYPDFYTYGDVAKFRVAAETGRDGLGTVNVKSAGNDNIDGNGDSLDASRFTVTVGAIDSSGQAASYSTYGAHLLVSAPAGSVTTDMAGLGPGYDGLLGGDYTNIFGGTSAAGPVTAGVITLMYEANTDLGWRDVQNILAYSAIGVGSLYTGTTTNENHSWKWNGADNWNGGGLHFSEDYGYGMVNAFTAVRMAEVWSLLFPEAATSANEATASTGTVAANTAIDDLSTTRFSFTVADNILLEHVDLTLSLTHSYFKDLQIALISPDGTRMSVYNGSTGSSSTADWGMSYSFGIDGLRGEMSAGSWTVEITDRWAQDAGTLNSVSFNGFGASATTGDVYHYTDEFVAAAQKSGQAGRLTLEDLDGGTDWINAAAMSADLSLDLNDGAISTRAGATLFTIAQGTVIEHAIAGDGDDTLTGNDLANYLYGMRGDDTLAGGLGNDIINGGTGTDTCLIDAAFADCVLVYFDESGALQVTSSDGIDEFRFVEIFTFLDVTRTIGELVPGLDVTGPQLRTVTPADNAMEVAVDSNLVLTFSEAVTAVAGGTITILNSASGTAVATIAVTDSSQVTVTGTTITVNPTLNLQAGSDYHVLVSAGAFEDASGNDFAGLGSSDTFNFSTVANVINGTSSGNRLTGTAVNDRINGLGGNDTLTGNAGNDWLDGGSGYDTMTGGAGDDTYVVDNTRDKVSESSGQGTDQVFSSVTWTLGSNLENLALTGTSNISGTGNALANRLEGNSGANTLSGSGGDDWLFGKGGVDSLTGGTGRDTFAFDMLPSSGIDRVRDFSVAEDRLAFSLSVFGGLTGDIDSTLAASAFVRGTAAADASDRLIYNSGTGALYYDADGVGGTGQQQVATLGTGLLLTAGNFLLIA